MRGAGLYGVLGRVVALQGFVLLLGNGAVGQQNIQQLGYIAFRSRSGLRCGRLAESRQDRNTKNQQQSQGGESAEPASNWTNSDPSVTQRRGNSHSQAL